MTQIEWENILLQSLSTLAPNEQNEIAAYYREIYGDKLDAGLTPDEILTEFGSPQECAQRILQEAGKIGETDMVTPTKEVDNPSAAAVEKSVAEKKKAKWTPSMIVGMAFLTLLLILPLAGAAVGVIAVFAACSISGGATFLAGGIYSVFALFFGIFGMELGGILANVGLGVAAIGVGFLLCVGFYYATKYTAIACWKALCWVYKRGE